MGWEGGKEGMANGIRRSGYRITRQELIDTLCEPKGRM